MKRKILIVLLAALIMALVFSCTAEEETNTPYTADGESVEIDEQEPNSVIVYTDDLGDFDFEGYEFSMLTRLNPRFTSPINVEEEIG